MLTSNYSIIKDCIIFDIHISDLYMENFLYEFSTQIEKLNKKHVILNLKQLKVITSDDILRIENIVTALKLNGKNTIVCGINPHSASILFSFIDNIKFNTALDVQDAFNVFSY